MLFLDNVARNRMTSIPGLNVSSMSFPIQLFWSSNFRMFNMQRTRRRFRDERQWNHASVRVFILLIPIVIVVDEVRIGFYE